MANFISGVANVALLYISKACIISVTLQLIWKQVDDM